MLSFLSFLYLLSFLIHGHAQNPVSYPYLVCLSDTFTHNSTYQSNLKLLFSNLSANTNRFFNTSVGRPPNDIVYGLFQCRGDVTDRECQNCLATATRDTAQLYCPLRKGAVIWYDDCTLRYSDQSFFSTVSTQPSLGILNTGDIDLDKARFNQLVMTTLRTTATEAATTVGGLFATHEADFTSDLTLYTLAQCTGDLSNLNCQDCLTQAVRSIPSCCTNKRGGRVLFPSCYVRYEVYDFYDTTTIKPTPPPPSGENRASTVIIMAIVISSTVFTLLFMGYCFLRRRANSREYSLVNEDGDFDEITNTVESIQFDFNTIEAATHNFSVENKLGEGGFGPVYKGTLGNGQEIAVKRLSSRSLQGCKEFKNEVMLVAKLQHRNLVRLLGFCLEGREKILVYEYISNKSLDYYLFDSVTQRELDWSMRYNIINGIARGMLYLHEDSQLRVIHRDLKASNIMLDRDMNPKISDFGLARIVHVDQSQENTNRIVGTHGYMAPEYAMHGKFSLKSDVYSFGVLIMEIISGKRNNTFYLSNDGEDMVTYVWKLWKDETPFELLDVSLRDNYSRDEVLRCIHIALLCVSEDFRRRPSIASIILMLNSYSITLTLPK